MRHAPPPPPTSPREAVAPSGPACVAWEEFRLRPSLFLFRRFLRLIPSGGRPAWTARAIAVVEGAHLDARLEFLVALRETARLARAVDEAPRDDLVSAGFLYLDPAARRLSREHPASAARAQVAIALEFARGGTGGRFLALIPLRKARLLFRRAGQVDEWAAVVEELLGRHPRARQFQDGLRAVDAGKREDPELADHRARRSLWARGARL